MQVDKPTTQFLCQVDKFLEATFAHMVSWMKREDKSIFVASRNFFCVRLTTTSTNCHTYMTTSWHQENYIEYSINKIPTKIHTPKISSKNIPGFFPYYHFPRIEYSLNSFSKNFIHWISFSRNHPSSFPTDVMSSYMYGNVDAAIYVTMSWLFASRNFLLRHVMTNKKPQLLPKKKYFFLFIYKHATWPLCAKVVPRNFVNSGQKSCCRFVNL